MDNRAKQLTIGSIFIFWVPLAATWLMMSVEGPFLSALIARLPQEKFNLAAYGVAFSLALIIEAPVIMMMSASTALVKGRQSFIKLRNFTFALNTAMTLIMLIFLIPDIFEFITIYLIGLPQNVSDLTHLACMLLLPWPGAIGYRRFYQGILINANLTRRVAYGTIIRLMAMSITATVLFLYFDVPGVVVGASALSAGVVAEALATRFMVFATVKNLAANPDITEEKTGYLQIINFYYPLALTSTIALAAHPMVAFFVGKSRFALESLAVIPVINALVFIFRSLGLSYQEVGISLIGERFVNFQVLRKFAIILGSIVAGTLLIISFSPLAEFWFRAVSGLSPELTEFAITPLRIIAVIPGLSVLLSWQRAMQVNTRRTAPVTFATIIEVGLIVLILWIGISLFDLVGAVAAAIAIISGRIGANLYLMIPYFKITGELKNRQVKSN